MSIFKNMFNNNKNKPVDDPVFDTIFSYISNSDDFDVDDSNVWRVSSDVFSIVTRIANDIADKPLVSSTTYKNSLFNGKVNKNMTSRTWIVSTLINLLLWGDSFTLIKTDQNNMVSDLVLLPTPKVTIYKGNTDDGLTYQYNNDKTFSEDQILHFSMNSINGMTGNSCLAALKDVLKLSKDSNTALQKYYKNLSFSRFILSVDDKLTSSDKNKLKAAFQKNLGLNSDGSSIVTDNSVKITPLKMSGITGDILKQTKQNDYFAKKLCSSFHMPGFILGIQNPHASGDSEYSKYKLALRPYENILTDELSAKLASDFEFKDKIQPLTCTDISNLVKAGAITQNDARNLLGLND